MIYTIFGQIEEAAALHIIEKHKLIRIEVKDFPPEVVKTDSTPLAFGQPPRPACFAVLIPDPLIPEFEETIANLRA